MTKSTAVQKRFRIQGTDGIRREVRPSTDPALRGLTPQQAFLEKGVITDAFMECYAHAHATQVLKTRRSKTRTAFVVGWDPRDVSGLFTEAVIRGVRKAGADAWVLGVVPTPLVPLYMQYAQAGGGFMVTASHNPKDQNGIKTFLAWRGMKLLPENDIALTRALLNAPPIQNKPLKGARVDRRDDALSLFLRFSLDPENSWITGPDPLRRIVLVVDPARGSLTKIAASAFRRAGFGRVIEVNGRLDGNVNRHSGVADLEGHKIIPADAIRPNAAFARHKAVCKLFELGRKHREEILNATRRVAGAVFDADGDRFYRLDYDPFRDRLIVSSGDETAYMQARYLVDRDAARYRSTAYIHTVESDLNTGLAAERLGLRRHLAAVGDKWILLRIAWLTLAARLDRLQGPRKTALKKKLDALKQSDRFDVSRFEALEKEIDRAETQRPAGNGDEPLHVPLAVGSEETGHNITLGRLNTADGRRIPVFCGNGLKSALNTFAATESLLAHQSPQGYAAKIAKPFPPGFKATLYAYYVRQREFFNGSAVWSRVQRLLRAAAREHGYACKTVTFREDPDMLYLALTSPANTPAAVFVRNSGTENKIGINLRGAKKDAGTLRRIGDRAVKLLFQVLKDEAHHCYKVELDLLSRIAGKPLPESQVTDSEEQRVLHEMGRQNLVRSTSRGLVLTPLGKWYISH